jgi:putative hydrolase of the HAD superfamily
MSNPLIVFDLDDTLYLERDYALSGYDAVADWLRDRHKVEGFAETCRALLDSGQRAKIFDRALAQHGVAADAELIEQLVSIYRSHTPRIALASDAARYLGGRGDGFVSALITDGPEAMQQAKVRALGLDRIISCIVCTGSFGPGFGKPHPRGFETVEAWASTFGRPLVYVADNPLKDFVTARRRGWRTVCISRPDRVHRISPPDPDHEADRCIVSLDELDACLAGSR